MLEESLEYIHANPEVYFTQRARKGGYICPICGNGSGSDGTGVKLIRQQTFRYKCFKCGTSGDVINFYAVEHHISNEEAIQQMLSLYGFQTLTLRHENRDSLKSGFESKDDVANLADEMELLNVIAEDIAKAIENLNQTSYFESRGISKEVAARYSCGFIKGWVHPRKRNDKSVVPSDRVIIPTSAESYIARAVDTNNKLPKLKAGTSHIFNIEVLRTSKDYVAVVEGEFDALSIIEAGNDAIALGSTTNVDKLLNWLKDQGVRPKKPLLIDLDADESGRKAAVRLSEGLAKLKIKREFFSFKVTPFKDQNEALVGDRVGFIRRVRQIPQILADQKLEVREKLSDAAKIVHWESKISHGNLAISTGWRHLDKALEGGLYEGLYVIPGATGVGKTAFALQMAYQVASQGRDVLYISLEMSEEEIYERHISRISYELYGNTSQAKSVHSIIQERRTVPEAVEKFRKVALYLRTICGVGSIDADDIRRIVENYEYDLGVLPVVFVDYLQILKPHDARMTDKQAVDYNVLRLKQLSRDYKISVVALASMNRMSYSDVISMVSIKESGAIEYTSDVCIGLQMAAMESIAGKGRQGQQEKQVRYLKTKVNREMQAVILKHRNGAIGAEIPFKYCAMFNHFEDEEPDEFSSVEFEDVPDI